MAVVVVEAAVDGYFAVADADVEAVAGKLVHLIKPVGDDLLVVLLAPPCEEIELSVLPV